jgi:hypothetical protein
MPRHSLSNDDELIDRFFAVDSTQTPFALYLKRACYAIFVGRITKLNTLQRRLQFVTTAIWAIVIGIYGALVWSMAVAAYHDETGSVLLCTGVLIVCLFLQLGLEFFIAAFRLTIVREPQLAQDFVLNPALGKLVITVLGHPIDAPTKAGFDFVADIAIEAHAAPQLQRVETVDQLCELVHDSCLNIVRSWAVAYLGNLPRS